MSADPITDAMVRAAHVAWQRSIHADYDGAGARPDDYETRAMRAALAAGCAPLLDRLATLERRCAGLLACGEAGR